MRLVISFLWPYYVLPSILFTNLFFPQSYTPSPRPSVTAFGTLNQSQSVGQLSDPWDQKDQNAFIQIPSAALLPASYQVELKTKVILKDSRSIISPFCLTSPSA